MYSTLYKCDRQYCTYMYNFDPCFLLPFLSQLQQEAIQVQPSGCRTLSRDGSWLTLPRHKPKRSLSSERRWRDSVCVPSLHWYRSSARSSRGQGSSIRQMTSYLFLHISTVCIRMSLSYYKLATFSQEV